MEGIEEKPTKGRRRVTSHTKKKKTIVCSKLVLRIYMAAYESMSLGLNLLPWDCLLKKVRPNLIIEGDI